MTLMLALPAAPDLAQFSRAKPSAVVLRCNCQQTQETAPHRFLRTKATTLRNSLDWQARLRQQASRCFHSQPFHSAARWQPSFHRIVPAETTLTHSGLASEHRKRNVVGQMPVDPLMERPEFVVCCLQRQGCAELRLSAWVLEKDDQVASDGERYGSTEVLFDKGQRQIDASRDA